MGGKERRREGSDGLAVAAVRWFGSPPWDPHSAICASESAKCLVLCHHRVWALPGMAVTTYAQSRRPVCTSQSTPTQILEFTWKPIVVIVPPVCTLINV